MLAICNDFKMEETGMGEGREETRMGKGRDWNWEGGWGCEMDGKIGGSL